MNRLDSLQQEVLRAFFEYESRFFLTGGAALAGFHLQHRTTKDLELFTVEDRIDEGAAALAAIAQDLGGSLESLVVYVDFRRYLLRRGSSSVVVERASSPFLAYPEGGPAWGAGAPRSPVRPPRWWGSRPAGTLDPYTPSK